MDCCCLCGFKAENVQDLEAHIEIQHWDIYVCRTSSTDVDKQQLPSKVIEENKKPHSGPNSIANKQKLANETKVNESNLDLTSILPYDLSQDPASMANGNGNGENSSGGEEIENVHRYKQDWNYRCPTYTSPTLRS